MNYAIDIEGVNALIDKIIEEKDDPERTHSLTDQLYIKVLKACAEGAPNASELAHRALYVEQLDLVRWYA